MVYAFDKEGINRIIKDLIAEGLHVWAERLQACEKKSTRAGSLRITREK